MENLKRELEAKGYGFSDVVASPRVEDRRRRGRL